MVKYNIEKIVQLQDELRGMADSVERTLHVSEDFEFMRERFGWDGELQRYETWYSRALQVVEHIAPMRVEAFAAKKRIIEDFYDLLRYGAPDEDDMIDDNEDEEEDEMDCIDSTQFHAAVDEQHRILGDLIDVVDEAKAESRSRKRPAQKPAIKP